MLVQNEEIPRPVDGDVQWLIEAITEGEGDRVTAAGWQLDEV
ncbi:hypothetical protein ACPOL_4766 [Acidisarcina polymorpha]|uniref:Uncharacterized protein n=1 Tax=Acidisarcina polymorpha TaxID=2211140 RepID=A0A2Z5G4F6_9BACT|nr:hypothetical protein ACPOL_4766 [Acidisarcina polymorpha]